MRYAQIRSMDVSNGEGVGVSLFVQGCPFHCPHCFNQETWDFDGGKQWNEDTKNKFLSLIDRPYISRVSLLGGEPLASENLAAVLLLIKDIITKFPDKSIWLYTGYTWENIMNKHTFDSSSQADMNAYIRQKIVENVDVLVDGRYEHDKRDITLKWRGSSNQRVIDVDASIESNHPVLYCD